MCAYNPIYINYEVHICVIADIYYIPMLTASISCIVQSWYECAIESMAMFAGH